MQVPQSTLQPIANRFPQVSGVRDSALVAIAIGSNLGNPRENLEGGLRLIQRCRQTQLLQVSPCFWTEPVYPEEPNLRASLPPADAYLNGAALLQTSLSPVQLMEELLAIETELGRIRPRKWASRTLDLDILLWQDQLIDELTVQIPHPRMQERAFVLVPLRHLVPHWCLPTGRTRGEMGTEIAQLAETVGTEGVNLENPIFLNWQHPDVDDELDLQTPQ